MKNLLKVSAIACASILASGSVIAAEQGEESKGDSSIISEGNLNITFKVPYLIELNGLDDIDLGEYQFDSVNNESSETFCVRTNSSVGFSVNFSSETSGGVAFQLESDDGNATLPYSLEMATIDSTGNMGTYSAVVGASDIDVTEKRSAKNCSVAGVDTDNVAIKVTVDGDMSDLSNAHDYSDVLYVVVSPN